MRFFISGCSPDHDSARMTSSAVIMPRSPWLASAACTKKAGVPVEAKVAAILRATWPDLPSPVTITRPLAWRIRSAAAAKAVPSGPCSAAAIAVTPLLSVSSVRRADCTAALAGWGSVPDDFVISGFGLAIPCSGVSRSRELRRDSSPRFFLAWADPRCDAGGGSQRPINHNCFKSINDVSTGLFVRVWNSTDKRMNSLGYSYRDVGSSQGPPKVRVDFARLMVVSGGDWPAGRPGAAAKPDVRPVAPLARRLRVAAGFAV